MTDKLKKLIKCCPLCKSSHIIVLKRERGKVRCDGCKSHFPVSKIEKRESYRIARNPIIKSGKKVLKVFK